MTEVRFYHLERTSLDKALAGLLEKCLERGWRAVVLAGSRERVEQFDTHLWTFAEESFLPHGAAPEPEPAAQPVWLTDRPENPNGATVLFLVDGVAPPALEGWSLVCDVFDGADVAALGGARERWRTARADGHAVNYWQQDASGRWRAAGEREELP